MITIKPFCAVRPVKDKVQEVAALPYDVVTDEEAKMIIENNPYSFLNVDKPEAREISTKKYANHIEAARYLEWMIKEGVLEQDKIPQFYLYGLEVGGCAQYGVVGCFACQDYEDGRIKKHENTRSDKEEDRTRHVAYCKAHTGPIFMAYKQSDILEALIHSYRQRAEALYEFIDAEGVRQVVYQIKEEDNHAIQEAFKQMESLYIADGHHRAAAACSYARNRGEENEDAEFRYFLGVAFSKDVLHIMDYNRIIAHEKDFDKKQFFTLLKKVFDIILIEDEVFRPMARHHFGMRCDGKWYELIFKEAYVDEADPIKSLDVSILQDYVLEPLFGICEPKTDSRIEFVGGIRGIEELNEKTNEDNKIAFSLYPTVFDEIIAVADDGGLMPPKSTWFEPKLRSGIFIHIF